MGSYGIGPGRVMGTIAEMCSDEKGLIWPESVAPFVVHLIALTNKKISEGTVDPVKKVADDIYQIFTKRGVDILYDDRDATAGEKFSDSDLIGIPVRYVVSEKTLANNEVEMKDRKTGKVEMVKISDFK